jgi:hypothetical protein
MAEDFICVSLGAIAPPPSDKPQTTPLPPFRVPNTSRLPAFRKKSIRMEGLTLESNRLANIPCLAARFTLQLQAFPHCGIGRSARITSILTQHNIAERPWVASCTNARSDSRAFPLIDYCHQQRRKSPQNPTQFFRLTLPHAGAIG